MKFKVFIWFPCSNYTFYKIIILNEIAIFPMPIAAQQLVSLPPHSACTPTIVIIMMWEVKDNGAGSTQMLYQISLKSENWFRSSNGRCRGSKVTSKF